MDGIVFRTHIEPFLNEFNNAPQYISNSEIEQYLIDNNLCSNKETLLALMDYYVEINTSRYILKEYLAKIGEDENSEVPLPAMYQDFINSLKLRKYSNRTVKTYSSSLKTVNGWLFREYKKTIDDITSDMALKYFLFLVDVNKSSYSTIRIHRFAISYYCNIILKKTIDLSFMNKMKKDKHLPAVLTHGEIMKVLKSINNIKHRMMISLLYSSGLRVSEVTNIKVADISLENLTIKVKQGKGKKYLTGRLYLNYISLHYEKPITDWTNRQ